MKRRLLDLCLLAYPRARRGDRDYLRDLALDLAEAQGLLPQAASLAWGGIKERLARSRHRSRRVAALATVLAAALAVGGASMLGASGTRHEVDSFACRVAPANADECASGRRLLVAHRQDGWSCAVAADGPGSSEWNCARSY